MSAEFYNNRGYAKARLGGYKEATEDYDKAIDIDPDYAFAYTNRGSAKDKLGDREAAIKDFSKAIEIFENQLGKCEKEKDYDEEIKIKKDCGGAYYNRGITHIQLSEYKKASEDFDKAIQLNPANSKDYLEIQNIADALHDKKKDLTKGLDFLNYGKYLTDFEKDFKWAKCMHRLFLMLLVGVTFVIYLFFINLGLSIGFGINLNIFDKLVQVADWVAAWVAWAACYFFDISLLDEFKACSSDTITVHSSDTPLPEPCPSDPPKAPQASSSNKPWFLFLLSLLPH